MTAPDRTLLRSITLPQLVLYGLGTTIGAGIYALTGEVAGLAGYGAPLSFLIASLLAGLTALSFAELSSRFPRAAGAALYVQQGLGIRSLAAVTGMMVAAAGIVSAAALSNAFADQLGHFVDFHSAAVVTATALIVVAIAAKGIRESVFTAALITLVEISGLLLVLWASHEGWMSPAAWHHLIGQSESAVSLSGVLLGALLAFYAFIGFEDMVDVSEEVRSPTRTLPRAIIITLVSVTGLYVLIMLAAVLAAAPETLANQAAPLVFLYQHYQGGDGTALAVIGLFAIINGALVQIVMASRVIYGLASRGQLPAALSSVNPRTHTPLQATLVAGGLLLLLALAGDLALLAEITSILMLAVFMLVNLALLRLKVTTTEDTHTSGFRIHPLVPLAGALTCGGFLLVRLWHLLP